MPHPHPHPDTPQTPPALPPPPPLDPPAAAPPPASADAFRHDPRGFAETFFADLCGLPWNRLHRHLFERRAARGLVRPERRQGSIEVTLAPRGAAKSTLVSLIFPIHALLHGLEPYIVLIAATLGQARRLLTHLRRALISGEPLRRRYAEVFAAGFRHTESTVELGGARVDAFSAGSEIRGIRHGAWRPTWIILDDIERSDRVHSPRYRDWLADWFREVIEPLGAAGTNIDLVGTLLHRDALPARLMRRPDVAAAVFRAILREADDQQLWDAWRTRLSDLSNPARLATARAFYEAHRPQMDRGAEVLWEPAEDYYDLCLAREVRGRAAFDQEKQNDPWGDDHATFDLRLLRRFRLAGGDLICDPPRWREPGPGEPADGLAPRVALSALRRFGFLDPALGGRRGDFAAIATLGADDHGYLYLLDLWLERATPSAQVDRLFTLHETWSYDLFGVEANASQKILLDLIERERASRRQRRRPWRVPVSDFVQRGAKQARIAALEPFIRAGWLLFNADLPDEFLRQLREFPQGEHDDGPDALAAAVDLARHATLPHDSLLTRPRPRRPF